MAHRDAVREQLDRGGQRRLRVVRADYATTLAAFRSACAVNDKHAALRCAETLETLRQAARQLVRGS